MWVELLNLALFGTVPELAIDPLAMAIAIEFASSQPDLAV